MLAVSCFKDADECTEIGEPYSKDFTLIVENETVNSVIVKINAVKYRPDSEDFGEMGLRISYEDTAVDENGIASREESQLIISYFYGWSGDDGSSWGKSDYSSFMIEFEFESGEKISYWGLPQECDVIGYGADYYGIAYVSKYTDGLYTVYDEDNRFADFALKAVINSPDNIEISVDYENSVIVEITD
ncbi:MAG: hypothetical protein JXK07_14405 [Spirochaetes bacterium]|nr:hypothetical protein [Spirochaetota bacterium]